MNMLWMGLTVILTIVVCILWAKAKKGWGWGLVPLFAGVVIKAAIESSTGDVFVSMYAYIFSTIALFIMLFMAVGKKEE